MKQDDDILNMSDEEIIELEKAMINWEYEQEVQKHKNKIIIFSVIIGVAIVIGLAIFFGLRGCSFGDDNKKKTFAETAAKQVISNTLKSPSTAIWNEVSYMENDDLGHYIVYVDVEAQNSFGAYLRSRFFVIIKDINLKDQTFSYNKLFPYIECTGKNDTYNLNLIKSINNYHGQSNENTNKVTVII